MSEDITLVKGFTIELNNGKSIAFSHMSSVDNPIFIMVGTKYQVTILGDVLYSATQDYDEPCCPLKEEYQSAFLKEYQYDFFRSVFTKKL